MFKKKNFLSNIPQAGFEPMTCSRMKGTTVGTVLSARVVINFEIFLEAILFVNLVRFLFKKLKNFKNYFFIIEL